MALTKAELKQKITDLVMSYVGGLTETKFKTLLNDIVDSIGTGSATLSIVEEPKTANFSITDADAFKLYVINSASAVSVTVPTGLTAGNWWGFFNIGTGVVSFVSATGVTIQSADNRKKLRTQFSFARAVARANDQNALGGDIVL